MANSNTVKTTNDWMSLFLGSSRSGSTFHYFEKRRKKRMFSFIIILKQLAYALKYIRMVANQLMLVFMVNANSLYYQPKYIS